MVIALLHAQMLDDVEEEDHERSDRISQTEWRDGALRRRLCGEDRPANPRDSGVGCGGSAGRIRIYESLGSTQRNSVGGSCCGLDLVRVGKTTRSAGSRLALSHRA